MGISCLTREQLEDLGGVSALRLDGEGIAKCWIDKQENCWVPEDQFGLM